MGFFFYYYYYYSRMEIRWNESCTGGGFRGSSFSFRGKCVEDFYYHLVVRRGIARNASRNFFFFFLGIALGGASWQWGRNPGDVTIEINAHTKQRAMMTFRACRYFSNQYSGANFGWTLKRSFTVYINAQLHAFLQSLIKMWHTDMLYIWLTF